MDKKLEFIRETLIDKMYEALSDGKITSTEQLLNFAKAYGELAEKAPEQAAQSGKDTI